MPDKKPPDDPPTPLPVDPSATVAVPVAVQGNLHVVPVEVPPPPPIRIEPESPQRQASVAPTTTEQQDITRASQRRVNLIWEVTQAIIAVLVVGANVFAALWNVTHGTIAEPPLILTSLGFVIVTSYFQRTNHTAVGGIGTKPTQEYMGR